MTDDDADLAEETLEEEERQTPPVGQGGLVYGLGFIGALVWFWRQADSTQDHVLGVLKALVWPAFLVYGAFKALNSTGDETLRTLAVPDPD